MLDEQARCWTDLLRPALAAQGIDFPDPVDYSDEVRQFLEACFRSEIYPLLTPLAFDPGHPFPLISNRSLNFAVAVRQGRRTKCARVKVPPLLPRFVPIPRSSDASPAAHTFAFLEDVMRMSLGDLFPGVQRIEYRELLVAPANLREQLRALIEREAEHARAGRSARLIIKNNAITDVDVIALLYRASQAGVDIDLIVRGVCCLRPGVPGVSDRIRVRSVVGRFLEHSRLYYFENGGDPTLYIGSADLMERNLDRRVETLCRIRDAGIARELRDVVLDAYLRDNQRAYELVNGSYRRVLAAPGEAPLSAQHRLLDWYTQNPRAPTKQAARNAERACAGETDHFTSPSRVRDAAVKPSAHYRKPLTIAGRHRLRLREPPQASS